MALLEVLGLTRRFGGLIAVNNVTLSVDAGEIRGLIGPNGAGKTTLFNLLTGVLRPTAGRVRFEGADITGEPTHRLVRRGIVRTYQLSQLFAGFTVFRNVLSALHVHARSGFWAGLLELPAVRRHNDALARAGAGDHPLRRSRRTRGRHRRQPVAWPQALAAGGGGAGAVATAVAAGRAGGRPAARGRRSHDGAGAAPA